MKLKKEFHKLKTDDRHHKTAVPVIGLTGGIATGKSTVSEILKSEGIPVICADELVKEIYRLASTRDHLKQHYPDVISEDAIDFEKLREKFFTDKTIKADIEALIYARLPEVWAIAYNRLTNPAFVVYDVPLLFEKNLEKYFDMTVLVYAPREVQRERLVERDEITTELADNILNHQMDIEAKKSKSDFVIDNSGDIEELGEGIEEFLSQITY
jgi:dephospho-CoA kinase